MGFKSLAVTSLALVTAVSGTAFAQKRAPNTQTEKSAVGVSRTSQEKGSDNIAWLKARTTVGAYISTASTFDAGSANFGRGTISNSGSGTANTSSAMGIEAQVINMRDDNWGLYGAVAIEQTREIDSVRLSLGGPARNLTFDKKPFYRPLFVSGGLVYRFNPKFYAIGGFNYSPFKETGSGTFDSSSMESKLGYQVGIAFRPIPRFSVELSQKVQRFGFSGSMKDGTRLNLDDMNLVGFAVTGRYSIE